MSPRHPLPPAAASDPHDLAVQAIWTGEQALLRRDVASIEHAIETLAASGAMPSQGSDLALEWQRQRQHIAGRALRQPPPVRGRALGAAYRKTMVEPGHDLVLEQVFLAGQKAKVSVVPGGGAVFRFSVAEEKGNTVCTRDVGAAPAACAWLPIWTSRYRIEVKNRGRSAAHVYVVIS